MHDRGVPRAVRTAVFAVGAAAAAFASWVVATSTWWSMGNLYDRVAVAVMIAGFWLLLAASVWLCRWRPSGRSWWLVWAMCIVWSAWAAAATSQSVWAALLSPVWLLRPLLFAILLSWPTGRLTRGDAWWLGLYSLVQTLSMTAWIALQRTSPYGADNPLEVIEATRVNAILIAFRTSVVLPVGALLLVVSVLRHVRRVPPSVRPIHTPIVIAAIVMAAGEVLLTLSAYVPQLDDTDPEANWFHGLLIVSNFVPFAAAPVLLVIAARRTSAIAANRERVHYLAIGPAAQALPTAVAAVLDDPTATVAYRRADGAWIDASGASVDLGGEGRSTTFVERDGLAIAAVDHAASIDRPTFVELAVAAAGSTIEFERNEAIARSREAEAIAARRAIIEAQDAARHRLERDVHDGAQQRLVGLALQATMAERRRPLDDADAVAVELRSGIATTRRELRDVANGLLPALVAERGLHASVATLAATAPMAVEVRIDQPRDLDPGVAAAVWFVVSEAVANATKHSGAQRLSIVGAVADGHLDIRVSDDGRGGAIGDDGSGLTGLRDRVARAGGALTVDSPAGRGTVVHATFPLEVLV